jgi:hypothetical protein
MDVPLKNAQESIRRKNGVAFSREALMSNTQHAGRTLLIGITIALFLLITATAPLYAIDPTHPHGITSDGSTEAVVGENKARWQVFAAGSISQAS